MKIKMWKKILTKRRVIIIISRSLACSLDPSLLLFCRSIIMATAAIAITQQQQQPEQVESLSSGHLAILTNKLRFQSSKKNLKVASLTIRRRLPLLFSSSSSSSFSLPFPLLPSISSSSISLYYWPSLPLLSSPLPWLYSSKAQTYQIFDALRSNAATSLFLLLFSNERFRSRSRSSRFHSSNRRFKSVFLSSSSSSASS